MKSEICKYKKWSKTGEIGPISSILFATNSLCICNTGWSLSLLNSSFCRWWEGLYRREVSTEDKAGQSKAMQRRRFVCLFVDRPQLCHCLCLCHRHCLCYCPSETTTLSKSPSKSTLGLYWVSIRPHRRLIFGGRGSE